MAVPIQVTFDCADADALAAFWAVALDYILQPPPPGFDSWEAFGEANDLHVEPGQISALVDPEGKGPRLFFQRVPEGKSAKNRVHLDVNVGGPHGTPPDERRARVDAKVAQLVAAGGTLLRDGTNPDLQERWVVMQDPEGNEFCVQ